MYKIDLYATSQGKLGLKLNTKNTFTVFGIGFIFGCICYAHLNSN